MRSLPFREDGTFTIVQFTDIHWKNGEMEDRESESLMKRIIASEKPDLVIFTGDVIHSELCRDPLESFRNAVRAVEKSGIPWGAVFGNHDAEHPQGTKEQLIQLQQQCTGCLTEAGPKLDNRVGNYAIKLQSHTEGKPAAVLYMLDSGSNLQHPLGGYEWISHAQIGWYKEQAAQLTAENSGEPLLALAFFHIPLPEYNELWNYHTSYGHNYEGMGCPKLNSGLFAAFQEMGDVQGVFTGHDHINDFWGDLYGIRLHYGRATGYNSYGREGFPRGARVIRIQDGEKMGFTTWLRLDDDTVVTSQPIHAPEQIWKRI